MRRRALAPEIAGAAEQERAGADGRQRPFRAPGLEIGDAALVVEEAPRAEAARHVEQVEVAKVLVHRVRLHHEAALVDDLGGRADDAMLDLAIHAERGHATKRVVASDEVEEGELREDEEGDALDHVSDQAMRNAAAAASPPMITVWVALRMGSAPVKRP